MADASDRAAPGVPEARCVACREQIRPGARLCPHCGSSQVREHWKIAGTALKWVGGVAAVISLLLAMKQVNDLLQSWRERQQAVTELVKAASLETSAGDYAGAWQLYGQALQLEPGSRSARDGQVDLAMVWLRNIQAIGGQTFSQLVDPMLPALYRAAANRKGQAAADALAHIGWANYLKNRDLGISGPELAGPQIEEEFRSALQIDPRNPYAHAMLGFWMLYRRGPIAEAERHFDEALKSGRERPFVQSLRLAALMNLDAPEADLELIRACDAMRRQGDAAPADERLRILEKASTLIRSPEWGGRLAAVIPPEDHLKTLAWLAEGADRSGDDVAYRFYRARLNEQAGNQPAALAEYRALVAMPNLDYEISGAATHGVERITGHNPSK